MIRLFRADDHQLDEILFDLIPTWPIINQMNLDLRSRLSLHFTVETIWYFQMASNQKNLLKFADELVKGTGLTYASGTWSMLQIWIIWKIGMVIETLKSPPSVMKRKEFYAKRLYHWKVFLFESFLKWFALSTGQIVEEKSNSWENWETKKLFTAWSISSARTSATASCGNKTHSIFIWFIRFKWWRPNVLWP